MSCWDASRVESEEVDGCLDVHTQFGPAKSSPCSGHWVHPWAGHLPVSPNSGCHHEH